MNDTIMDTPKEPLSRAERDARLNALPAEVKARFTATAAQAARRILGSVAFVILAFILIIVAFAVANPPSASGAQAMMAFLFFSGAAMCAANAFRYAAHTKLNAALEILETADVPEREGPE